MRIFLLLFPAALLLSSCDNLVNGVVRDIDLPPHESQLAASLFLDSRDSNISAIVSSSKGIYDTGQSKSVFNAECVLAVGATTYNWSTMDQYERYTELLPDRFGVPTDSLVFTVNHPDFTSVSATQVFPSAPQVSLELNYGATQLYGEISDELVITLKDIPGVNQHYMYPLMSTSERRFQDRIPQSITICIGKRNTRIARDFGVKKVLCYCLKTASIETLSFQLLQGSTRSTLLCFMNTALRSVP